jgi:hypothetical protein
LFSSKATPKPLQTPSNPAFPPCSSPVFHSPSALEDEDERNHSPLTTHHSLPLASILSPVDKAKKLVLRLVPKHVRLDKARLLSHVPARQGNHR